MADDQIKAYDRHGEKITIDKSEIGKLYALGGRVATNSEKESHAREEAQKAAETAVQARYDALPTYRKAAGLVTGAAGVLTGNPLLVGTGADLPPTLAAYGAGVRGGATLGAADAAARKVADAIGGKAAGDRYAQQLDEQAEASPIAHGAGELAGMAGTAAFGSASGALAKGAARVAPGAVSAIEGAAAKVAARGALGRAAVTAAEMGAQGAIEGGVYAGAQHATDQILHDKELAADKLFAAAGTGALYGLGGGAALGGAGSLAASGLQAAGRGISSAARSGLARALAPAAEEAGAVEARIGVKAVADAVANGGTTEAAVNAGLKSKANQMAVDALYATKTEARNALEYVSGGADAVGDYLHRNILKQVAGESTGVMGAVKTGMGGRADQLLPLIQADKAGRIGEGLSNAVKGTPARVNVAELSRFGGDIYDGMLKDPTKIAGAEAFISRAKLEASALYNAGKVAEDGTISAVDAFYARSDMAKQAYELGRASGAAGDAYKAYLKEWDRHTIGAIDRAAEQAGKSGVGDEIRHWKREWQLASAAEEMAAGGAERVAHNNVFGIREAIGALAGIATGHVLGGAATAIGGKLARERGSAVAAYTLGQLAERGSIAKWVSKVDDQIGKASKGLISPPAKGLLKASDQMPATKTLAKTALQRIGEYQADPEAFVEKASRQAESIGVHEPEIADAIVARQVRAMNFLSSKVPVTPDPDPMDPHPAPKMTPGEQAELGRYAWYVEKPARFFAEVSRGKITFEGAEVAQALMPRAFADLQERTMEAIATQMSKGNKLPYRQREMLGVLLDIAATPAQRPDHAAFLQKNVSGVLPSEEPPPAPAPKRGSPIGKIATQRSSYDRLEAEGPGRR